MYSPLITFNHFVCAGLFGFRSRQNPSETTIKIWGSKLMSACVIYVKCHDILDGLLEYSDNSLNIRICFNVCNWALHLVILRNSHVTNISTMLLVRLIN